MLSTLETTVGGASTLQGPGIVFRRHTELSSSLIVVVAAHNEDMTSFCEGKTWRHSRIGDDVEADARGEERRDHSSDGTEERTG